jgi:hypothetical protein
MAMLLSKRKPRLPKAVEVFAKVRKNPVQLYIREYSLMGAVAVRPV